jgi:hypothetical protein
MVCEAGKHYSAHNMGNHINRRSHPVPEYFLQVVIKQCRRINSVVRQYNVFGDSSCSGKIRKKHLFKIMQSLERDVGENILHLLIHQELHSLAF